MSKTFNNIHFDGEYDFSLGSGLGTIVSSGIFKPKPKNVGDKFWNVAKNASGKIYSAGSRIASNVFDGAASSAVGEIISDTIDKSESKLRSIFTANGRAKVSLDNMLHPGNNNGIELGVKLELSKLNSRLRSSGVPEKHIESATLLYLSALESSGDKELAKQFYLIKLRDCGVSGEHIVKCIQTSLGPQAIEWIKIAAAIGLVVGGFKLATSKSAAMGASRLLSGAGHLTTSLLGGATRLATGILSNAVRLVR